MGRGAGPSASREGEESTQDGGEGASTPGTADQAEGLLGGGSICSVPVPLTLQSFVLRSHSMNCSMLWVSPDSSSRSGGIAPQDPAVSGRNEGELSRDVNERGSLPPHRLLPSSAAPPFLGFLSSYCLLPFLCSVGENCSTRQQVTRRDKWGQLLLTTPTVSHSLAKHLGVPGASPGVPLEEEVGMGTPGAAGRKREWLGGNQLPPP